MSAKKSGAVKTEKQTVSQDTVQRVDIFEKQGSKAHWLALGVVALVALIVFKDYIFLNKIYLFRDIGSDSLNASWPWMAHAADYISQYGTPSWSFNMGMGQNLLPFSMYDPFDYLLYPFGKANMPYLIIFKELAKILITGIVIFRYCRTLQLSPFTSVIGALMFSFCGYMIVGSGWFLFSFEVMVAALLLWSFEKLYRENKWWWFALPMFLIGLSRPFNLWPYGLFLFMYILFRIYQTEEKFDLKSIFITFAKVAVVAVVALGVSGPFLLEHIQSMIDSPRGSGPDSYSHILAAAPMFETTNKGEFGTDVLRFFSNNIVGGGMNFKGAQNYLEAPLFYCGIPCLLLFAQYFQFLKKGTKRFAIALLVLWLMPIIFPYFRRAFWLFSGDYYRTYSFFVAIIFIFFSVQALDKILAERRIDMKALLITTIGFIILLNIPYFPDKSVVDGGMKLFAMVAILFYAGVLYMLGKKGDALNYKYALLAFFVIELSYFSWATVNRRNMVMAKDLAQKVGYNDYSLEAVDFVKKTDDSFYRIDKNYFSSPAMHGSLNDGMVQGYYGTSSYNPFNQLHYINYLKTMGVINKVNELESRWSPGLINRVILESLNGVKYVFSKSGYAQPLWHVTHDSVGRFGDVLVLKNKFVMPLAFGYAQYVKLSDFEKLSLAQKDYVSTLGCVLNDEDVSKANGLTAFNLKDTVPQNLFTVDLLKKNLDSLRRSTMSITEFKPVQIKGTIDLPSARVVYVSMPYDKNWSVTDNNSQVDKLVLTNGMTGLYLGKGAHALEFRYAGANVKRGILISLCSFCIFIALGLFFWLSKRKKAQLK